MPELSRIQYPVSSTQHPHIHHSPLLITDSRSLIAALYLPSVVRRPSSAIRRLPSVICPSQYPASRIQHPAHVPPFLLTPYSLLLTVFFHPSKPIQLIINPAKGHQFFVLPLLADSTPMHDQDPVRIANGGKSVGHNQGGPFGSHP